MIRARARTQGAWGNVTNAKNVVNVLGRIDFYFIFGSFYENRISRTFVVFFAGKR